MEKVVAKIMKADKAAELFQTMAIMSLNMGNLALEINTLRNILFMGEKEKAMLQEELDRQRKFQKGYKHNVEIWRKNNAKAKQKNKVLIKKLHDENEELKGSTSQLKSQDHELQNLKYVSLLQSKELKRKTSKVERKQFMEDKEYQRTLQHMQTQLERAQEQKKSLDLIGIKKRLKDYEQML